MRKFMFTVAIHDEFGEKGLRPKWYPTGDPLGGMAAAHDIFEHFPNDPGDTEGELMALGASMFIRGDGGYQSPSRVNSFDEQKDIPADFPEIWRHHGERERYREIRKPPRVQDSALRERCKAVRDAARRLLREEFDHPEASAFNALEWEYIAGWLAHGYQRARRRYRGMHAYNLAWFFTETEREADKALKYAEEGDEITIHVRLRNHNGEPVKAVVKSPYENGEEGW